MTDRIHQLEQLLDEIRSAELAVDVARHLGGTDDEGAAELAAAEARLEMLRQRHAMESGGVPGERS